MNGVFKALSDPTRREILRRLRHGELTAGELAAAFPQAKTTLSHHFAVLKQAGLITDRRNAQQDVEREKDDERHGRFVPEAAGGKHAQMAKRPSACRMEPLQIGRLRRVAPAQSSDFRRNFCVWYMPAA